MLKKLVAFSLILSSSMHSLEEVPAYSIQDWGQDGEGWTGERGRIEAIDQPENTYKMGEIAGGIPAVPAQDWGEERSAVPAQRVYYKIGRPVNAVPAVRAQPENTYKVGEIAGGIPAVRAQKNLAEIVRLQGWK